MIANVGCILCIPLFAVRVGAWNAPWLEALNEELEVLNAQARELEQTIAQNVAGILEA